MIVNDTLANTARAAHDVGLAAWLGGAMFGKFAMNPSVTRITALTERGAVTNAAWNGYNVVNAAGLGAAALGWAAARATETQNDELTGTEQRLSVAKDVLMGTALLTGLANGVQGIRLAAQAPDGAVAIQSGTEPAPETPKKAAGLQRSIGALGNANILAGVALVSVNAVLAQINYSHPSKKRALTRTAASRRTSPLWAAAAVATLAAGGDQARRAGAR